MGLLFDSYERKLYFLHVFWFKSTAPNFTIFYGKTGSFYLLNMTFYLADIRTQNWVPLDKSLCHTKWNSDLKLAWTQHTMRTNVICCMTMPFVFNISEAVSFSIIRCWWDKWCGCTLYCNQSTLLGLGILFLVMTTLGTVGGIRWTVWSRSLGMTSSCWWP